ncbi:MAG: phosphoglycerate kinase [Burkholderiales bacterium]|jgi:phosphoglycerate kinase|nr:phosphoglycerate kinase [Burkholderiales bacterium]
MHFTKITDLDLNKKTVFIRTDMNVPLQNGQITDDTRIKAGLITIKYALDNGAKVIVATHLGRPSEGKCTPEDSVKPIANLLSSLIGKSIPIVNDISNYINFATQDIVMLENVRCNVGEKENSQKLGQTYANLCDIYVHDAFATAHRAEASTDAIGYYAKTTCAGLLLGQELNALEKALNTPKHPIVAIVAGSKVSTKLSILNNLADRVDCLIVGGGILNTFLQAAGYNIGKSLIEADLVNEAKKIMAKIKQRGGNVPLPQDVITAKEFSQSANAIKKPIGDVDADDMILDIGQNFANSLAEIIKSAGTIIWNGPLGVFEFDQFASGTKIVANAIAMSNAYSLAGGGDTIAAINKFCLWDKIDYISTAGGALLEYLEGKALPAITMLKKQKLSNE